ncbi:MAG TPA: GH92 family glycosyl hydrolase [Pyrinomonadaceae bacterium]|nr:GH92 family glycosyl hydrolase [Pyrinomonadaceae bacterium]
MKMRLKETGRRLAAVLACLLLSTQQIILAQTRPRLVSYVDPFVGVDRDGNTVPGAAVPFGFSNPSPDTVPNTDPNRYDTSGYESGKEIIGFSQTHVSGTGGESKYGNFRVTPQVGRIDLKDLASPKKDERAEPGYYAVTLTEPDVRAELTTTRLVAVHRYTFPSSTQSHLILDTGSIVFTGGGAGRRQRPLASDTRVVAPNRIEGRGDFIGGWNPAPYTLHFSAEFSRPFKAYGTWRGTELYSGAANVTGEQTGAGAFVTFDTTGEQKQVEVKIGVSFLGTEKARRNVERETGGASFDEIRRRAAELWEQALAKIRVEGGTDDERRIFYTALYRSHYMPHDLTGENVWWQSLEPHYEDYYAIWDTFRTLHPLLTLIQPGRQRDMVRSLVDTYRHTGWMPDARIAGANGMTQGGSNSDVVIADALVKGLKGIDYQTAYQSMVRNAEVDSPRPYHEGRVASEYKERGYLSMKEERSASRTLEYSYNDFCLAQVAKALGKPADYRKYLARSSNWMNLWDAETMSVRPRESDGRWMTPYDKTKLYFFDSPRFTWMSAPYYEGSGYQYSTYVPHDAQGLINKVGGDAAFVKWLDIFFGQEKSPEQLRPEGLYTHGNEPDILASFLYIHAGRADRTQEQVRRLMQREYRTGRAGLPGNDDAGTMSSWYVWNAVGLYPNAGQNFYYVGSPVFTRATIDLGAGRAFTVEAPDASAANKYVQSATLNGRRLDRAWLTHAEIAGGGRLSLRMGDRPSSWGSDNRPPSLSKPPAPPVTRRR